MNNEQYCTSYPPSEIKSSRLANPKVKSAIALTTFILALSLFLSGIVYQISGTSETAAGISESAKTRELPKAAH
tara:strand:+ start:259 stop:480 length:222 start_codon:yes stop_codon:yes gene_type:complete